MGVENAMTFLHQANAEVAGQALHAVARAGLRIRELPVTWVEDPRSSVRLLSTAAADLRGLARVARTTHTPQR